MDIFSVQFIIFIAISTLVFYFLKSKYRVAWLIIISSGFISTFSYILLPYILIYAFINYYLGLKIPDSGKKVRLFRWGIIINLSQLVLLRYSTFAIDPIFRLLKSNIEVSVISEIIIPIGISYFTLQGIGYLVNVKMGWEKPEKNFLDFLLYIIYFPKFLSGPIERSNHFLPQLKFFKQFDKEQVSAGIRIVLIGAFKKLAISNQIAHYVQNAYADIHSIDGLSLWILLLLQPLYLYFDFSGYTDMAIGVSKIFGIDLLPNFNRPFFAQSMTNFWKRFHISLSSWFNDYIFRLAAFKYRKWGVYASIYALLMTWVLFGIWHGAGWNFMMLGFIQAAAIIYEYFTRRWRARLFSRFPSFFRIWFSRLVTYMFYAGSLVFFFAPDINSAFTYFSRLNNFNGPDLFTPVSVQPYMVVIFIAFFLFFELIKVDYSKIYDKLMILWAGDGRFNRFVRWTVYSVIITILLIVGNKSEQFIYVSF
jgi:D-alanyl-lipoteichoic acid acyltransferase DltB (MBOAT superfamily)